MGDGDIYRMGRVGGIAVGTVTGTTVAVELLEVFAFA